MRTTPRQQPPTRSKPAPAPKVSRKSKETGVRATLDQQVAVTWRRIREGLLPYPGTYAGFHDEEGFEFYPYDLTGAEARTTLEDWSPFTHFAVIPGPKAPSARHIIADRGASGKKRAGGVTRGRRSS
jgi:hypothetical protein